jgi:hypothetical protein
MARPAPLPLRRIDGPILAARQDQPDTLEQQQQAKEVAAINAA